jgi:hypothetical protein
MCYSAKLAHKFFNAPKESKQFFYRQYPEVMKNGINHESV